MREKLSCLLFFLKGSVVSVGHLKSSKLGSLQYYVILHPTQNTYGKYDKNTRKRHIQESQEANPFTAGDHNVSRNRQDNMTDKQNTQITKKDQQMKHRLGMVSKNITGFKHQKMHFEVLSVL